MRHIFLASIGTLAVVTGLLALPATGEPQTRLVDQAIGDRLALAAEDGLLQSRQLTEPRDPRIFLPTTTMEFAQRSQAVASAALVEELTDNTLDRGAAQESEEQGSSSLIADDPDSPGESTEQEEADEPEGATEPETSATETPSTTAAPDSTVASTTTTTAPPMTAAQSDADLPESGGVLVSPRGVVLPVIGRSSAGWRAMTPCGVEVTLDAGERIVTADFVLDPGHGGSETGAVGPNGAVEKTLNVRIAEIVRWYLEREGYSSVLTRSTDIRLPLRSRAEIANALEPKAFVSIHHNGGAIVTQSTPGTEVFVDGGNPNARRLGGIMYEEMTRRMSDFDADWVGTIRNGVSTRYNDEGADLYGIHRFTPDVPSVITEVGYLSNASEAELYVDNDVQWAHGRAIAEALMRWDRTEDAGSGYLEDFVDSSSSGTGGFDGCTDPRL